MTRLFLALLLAGGLRATVVTGTIRKPDLTLATGRAYIDLTGTCIGAGGAVVVNPTKIVQFTNGDFSVDIEPSSSCNPSQVYRVRYQVDGWNAPLQFWNVTGTAPTTIGAVQVPGVPVSGGATGIGFLTGLSCKGDLIAYTGSSTVRVPCPTVANSVLKKDAGAAAGVSWQPDTGGASFGSYSATVSPASTTWTVLGTAHAKGTCPTAVQAWISNEAAEDFQSVTCNPTTFDVVITFLTAQTGNIFLTTDPVFAGNTFAPSLSSTIVTSAITGSPITITHNLANVVLVRCFDGSGNRIGWDVATTLSANALTVTFVGSPGGFCIAAR